MGAMSLEIPAMPCHATAERRSGLRRRVFRALAVPMSVLLPLAGMPLPAFAQAEANGPSSDPPALVGQLTRISGSVSFHTADETNWQPADPNYPITSGNSLWTEPGAAASVVFGSNRLALDQSTELDLGTLDQHRLAASVPQGAVYLRVRAMQPGDAISIATPRGTVTIAQPGIYEIAAGDQATPTRVTVRQGSAQVYGAGVSSLVPAGQTAIINGASPFVASLGPAQDDAFLAAQLAAAAPPPPSGVAPPPVVAQMTGGDELEDTGTWQATPQYGQVWYPPVAASWVPYRDGHWAYVAPWGWTWVDDAAWGFAPFHYGRWIQVGGRWGWDPVVPGVEISAPVYAPALVAFFGIGVGVGLAIGYGHPVGWVPLAPFEPYHPWYRASPAYFRGVNAVNVRNVNNINVNNVYNNTTINHFANQRAVTVVPSQTMTGSRPVAGNVQRVNAAQFATARPFTSEAVRPTVATAGMTPGVAHQLGIAAPTPQRLAPGPVVRPTAAGAPVALRPAGGAPVVRPAITGPAAAGATTARPGEAAAPAAQRPAAPGAAAPGAAAPRAGAPSTGAPHATGAPGPAITPHAQGALPPLRPTTAPGATGATRAPVQNSTLPQARPAEPQAQHPEAQPQTRPAQPQVSHPEAQPQVARPAPEAQRPAPEVQRPATPAPAARPVAPPPPRPAAPAPAPRPEPPRAAPPAPHPAPAPAREPQRPVQPQRYNVPPPRPAPEQHAAPRQAPREPQRG